MHKHNICTKNYGLNRTLDRTLDRILDHTLYRILDRHLNSTRLQAGV